MAKNTKWKVFEYLRRERENNIIIKSKYLNLEIVNIRAIE
jgi:hypothetical protein